MFTPLLFSNHSPDGRNLLRTRYSNVLARLFPQFSEIFINSVLEEARGDLLAAEEWLVQLEERRSFMYPYFDPFQAVPVVGPHYSNAAYMQSKQNCPQGENASKFIQQPPLPNASSRYSREGLLFPEPPCPAPRYFINPQVISASGPPNVSNLFVPSDHLSYRPNIPDPRVINRASHDMHYHQSENDIPKCLADNSMVYAHARSYVNSHSQSTPSYVVQGNSTINAQNNACTMINPSDDEDAAYTNGSGNEFAITAKGMSTEQGQQSVVEADSVTMLTDIKDKEELDSPQKLNASNSDCRRKQNCNLDSLMLFDDKDAKVEDEHDLSVINEYIGENGGEGAAPFERIDRADYREETDVQSVGSSKHSTDSDLMIIHP